MPCNLEKYLLYFFDRYVFVTGPSKFLLFLFEVDFEEPQEIAAVATQGHPYKLMNSWVKEYFLNYSINGVQWEKYNKVINFSLIFSLQKIRIYHI